MRLVAQSGFYATNMPNLKSHYVIKSRRRDLSCGVVSNYKATISFSRVGATYHAERLPRDFFLSRVGSAFFASRVYATTVFFLSRVEVTFLKKSRGSDLRCTPLQANNVPINVTKNGPFC